MEINTNREDFKFCSLSDQMTAQGTLFYFYKWIFWVTLGLLGLIYLLLSIPSRDDYLKLSAEVVFAIIAGPFFWIYVILSKKPIRAALNT